MTLTRVVVDGRCNARDPKAAAAAGRFELCKGVTLATDEPPAPRRRRARARTSASARPRASADIDSARAAAEVGGAPETLHPPLEPVSAAAAHALVAGSHPKPGAHSLVPPHVVAHLPSPPQRYGAQLVVAPSIAVDDRPSTEHFAPDTHLPSTQL